VNEVTNDAANDAAGDGGARPIRVVLADDHPMVRYGVAAVLAAVEGVDLVGEAADGDQLLALVRRTAPDVVLSDLSMPGRSGLDVLRILARDHPHLPVLVLTMHADDDSVVPALLAGARGYLIKGADGDELVRAIRAVAAGDAIYGAPIAARIVALLSRAAGPGPAFPDLTDRERQVLQLLAAGLRNHAIAARLGLSEKTVRNHVSSVLLKLQVADRTAAALKAREAGLA
jgi:DNA-binding NarL/FixJ family response regulator